MGTLSLWPGSDAGPALDAAGAPAVISGLDAELVDRETARPGGGWAWTTVWRLCWTPVPAARDYAVTIVTSEGVDPRPRFVAKTCYSLTVASGTAAARGVRPGRAEQLALMESMLSVAVAARLRDGSIGPASPDFAVGREHAGKASSAASALEGATQAAPR